MNKLLKRYFRSSLLTSIFLLVLGGLLIFESEATIITISYVIGGILIALGVIAIIRYIEASKTSDNSQLDIVYGIVTVILGILIISNPKALASIIPLVLGVCIVINSASKLQYAFELKRANNEVWGMTMVVAIISTLCGVVLIFNPFRGATLITQVVGIFIIVYAILDLISTLTIKKNIGSIKKANKKSDIQEADIVEEEDNTKEIEDKK